VVDRSIDETTNEPVAETGDADTSRSDEAGSVAARSGKPTNGSDVGYESSAPPEQLSLNEPVVVESNESATGPETTNKPVVKTVDGDVTRTDEPVVVEGNESATGPDTTNKPVVKTVEGDVIRPDESVVVEGNESATGPDTTNKPVVKTVEGNVIRPDESVVVEGNDPE
jgi:hypothetical protein